ncbi:glutamate--cysteine ligase [Denitrificimonas sp. JX-1]|uniref:Glutamate--cysteine ligase n=1 Tax=Denitrificimonas halotolerans TaxID=3098930 RepID=A0ABU5GNE5_9GAMM|nr:glutamate--cysteine ligase [Denitrificimonas sp. JX-1]MDY7218451.1 glutamate--cysteine ligase [Denitrificimonas sp. JX-1]
MSDTYSRRLALLSQPEALAQLKHCLHGIERESLRVERNGRLALTPHPKALGSALTHSSITTDYSEALLEFITEPHHDSAQTLAELDDIHRFTLTHIDQEVLWSPSMPGHLPKEELIPIGEYGTSNVGQLKHVYRKGLAVRYGKTMQCIAGIHYNFSVPESIWTLLKNDEQDQRSTIDYQSARYIALIRNFRRYSWLLMYLFGASPALDISFLRGREHQLEVFDEDTLYLPYATSLRMSDLGYQSNAQAGITPCYNDLQSYTDSLRCAVSTPYPAYQAIGQKKGDEWLQINTNILQIENEYYSTMRPKRVTLADERPVDALIARGIQYVEARCIDINPFLPLGIDLSQARFLDTFLLYCALQDSPLLSDSECPAATKNFLNVVKQGRKPKLQLECNGKQITMQDWGHELLEQMRATALLLDQAYATTEHSEALRKQIDKMNNPDLTPSAQVLAHMREQQCSFSQFSLKQSLQHAQTLSHPPLDAQKVAHYEALAEQSHRAQTQLEQHDKCSFDEYMDHYLSQA